MSVAVAKFAFQRSCVTSLSLMYDRACCSLLLCTLVVINHFNLCQTDRRKRYHIITPELLLIILARVKAIFKKCGHLPNTLHVLTSQ